MNLDTLICELEEAWETGDESKYDLDNIDLELEKGINKIGEVDLRKQVQDYFGDKITSG